MRNADAHALERFLSQIHERLDRIPSFYQTDDAWLNGCFHDDTRINSFLRSAHWRMVLFGSKGAGMFNHQDTLRTASFHVQLFGIKRWHLCDKSHDMGEASDFNVFAPDYNRWPKMLDANCYLDDVQPGEILFYPLDYWHQTLTITDFTVSLTGTLVDANCHGAVTAELEKKCSNGGGYSTDVCEHILGECKKWWHDAFVGSFEPKSMFSSQSCGVSA